ncbi:MAG: hypothetical protein LIP03_09800, partial [Bacteroidales bacterium]|nr:hypothetical protein [Bacteroidales bacterium]
KNLIVTKIFTSESLSSYKKSDRTQLKKYLPEATGKNRDFIPDESIVLLGVCDNQELQVWINSTNKYPVKINDKKGSIKISPKLAAARYLLIHDNKKGIAFYRLENDGPSIWSFEELSKLGYSMGAADDIYLLYSLTQAEKEFEGYEWNIQELEGILYDNEVLPFTSLTHLMGVATYNYAF